MNSRKLGILFILLFIYGFKKWLPSIVFNSLYKHLLLSYFLFDCALSLLQVAWFNKGISDSLAVNIDIPFK